MRVRFKSNLGSRDALTHGLNYHECTAGSEHEFDNRLSESLIQRGFVSPVDEPKPRSVRKSSSRTSLKTVPGPVETKPSELEVKTSADE